MVVPSIKLSASRFVIFSTSFSPKKACTISGFILLIKISLWRDSSGFVKAAMINTAKTINNPLFMAYDIWFGSYFGRSEERRVGKECRSGCETWHYKKIEYQTNTARALMHVV